jgi:peptidoglycan/LPS O-acetylase OafA/YrhL
MQESSGRTDKHSFLTLDAIRGVAAIGVMFYHYAHISHSEFKFFGMSFVAVDMFFCLSGFILSYSYSDRLSAGMTGREFMIRRLVRLYPFYLIGLAVGAAACALNIGLHRTSSFDFANLTIAVSLGIFFLPYLYRGAGPAAYYDFANTVFPLNDPAWSLFFELFANAFYAAFIWTYRSLLAVILVSSAGFLLTVWYLKTRAGWSYGDFWGGFPRVTLSFFIGALLFRIWKDGWLPKIRISTEVILMLTAILLLIPAYKPTSLFVLSVFVFVPFLISIGAQNEPASSAASLCSWLGRISFGLYAIHVPIYTGLDAIIALTGISLNTFGVYCVAAVSATASIAGAHLLTKYVDEPQRPVLMRRLQMPGMMRIRFRPRV